MADPILVDVVINEYGGCTSHDNRRALCVPNQCVIRAGERNARVTSACITQRVKHGLTHHRSCASDLAYSRDRDTLDWALQAAELDPSYTERHERKGELVIASIPFMELPPTEEEVYRQERQAMKQFVKDKWLEIKTAHTAGAYGALSYPPCWPLLSKRREKLQTLLLRDKKCKSHFCDYHTTPEMLDPTLMLRRFRR